MRRARADAAPRAGCRSPPLRGLLPGAPARARSGFSPRRLPAESNPSFWSCCRSVDRQLDAHLGASIALAGDADPSSQTFDDVAGDRKTNAGTSPARREVGIEDARQVL